MSRETTASKILKILGDDCSPKTANEILMMVKKSSEKTNKTTVYRALSALVSQGRVNSFILEDKTERYEKKTTPHGHFVCQNCNSIRKTGSFAKQNSLEVYKVVHTEYGVCNKCLLHNATQLHKISQ